MKGYAMLKISESGWIEKETPKCGPLDAICKPLAVTICTSDIHTLWEDAIDRHNMILGQVLREGCRGWRSASRTSSLATARHVPAITQTGTPLSSELATHALWWHVCWLEVLQLQDGVFSVTSVSDADGSLAHMPEWIQRTPSFLTWFQPASHAVELAGVGFGDTVLVVALDLSALCPLLVLHYGASRIVLWYPSSLR